MNNTNISDLVEQSIERLPDQDALDHIGILIDAADDMRSAVAVDRAFILLDEIRKRDLAPDLLALTHYFSANAWSAKRHQNSDHDEWAWEQPEVEAQILDLRRSLSSEGFSQLSALRQCQIFTNLANQLNHIGRFIEAVEYFDRAIELIDNFAMALGNCGIALSYYARAVYDRGHGVVIMAAAHDLLQSAVSSGALYDNPNQGAAQGAFSQLAKEIANHVDVDNVWNRIDLHKHSLGRSKQEIAYRKWCLDYCLFVNPLNDLGAFPIAAGDVLTLPSITAEFSEQVPPIIGFFNQMKQEFVSARYIYYEGVNSEELHYADRDVRLYNTLDYPSYALSVEKVRIAFRLAYSILDKIAFFLNCYFSLGHNPKRVNFRGVWFASQGPKPRTLHERFQSYENWPLRGLYFLSKDIFEDDFKSVTEPDAEALKDIRDHLEHKYLQLHESWVPDACSMDRTGRMGLHLDRERFALKTLRLLKLVRASIIYLSLAVHAEERQRNSTRENNFVMPMSMDTLDDTWKR